MKIGDKEFKIAFSFNALCLLEEEGINLFDAVNLKPSPAKLKKLILAAADGNHNKEEVEAALSPLKGKQLKQVIEDTYEQLKNDVGGE